MLPGAANEEHKNVSWHCLADKSKSEANTTVRGDFNDVRGERKTLRRGTPPRDYMEDSGNDGISDLESMPIEFKYQTKSLDVVKKAAKVNAERRQHELCTFKHPFEAKN